MYSYYSTSPTLLRHRQLITIFYTLLLLCQLFIPAKVVAATAANSYSIVLASAPGNILKWNPNIGSLFKGYTLYVEKTSVNGAPWERLCLGYFDSRKQTFSLINKIQKSYPGAWVQKTPKDNTTVRILNQGTTKPPAKPAAKKVSGPNKPPKVNKSSLSDEKLKSLMDRANTEFKNKNYSAAVRYLTAIIAAGTHQYSREALELLGLARQRKGQKSHAVDIYEKYLAAYPEGEGSDRVRQRLAGLLTATRAGKKKIDMETVEIKDKISTYGSLSQYYRNNRTTTDDIGTLTTLSQLITYVDLTTTQKTSTFDHRYQFTSDHAYDFVDSRDSSEFRFIETYYELNYRKTGTSGRFGRQSLRIGGILKRFDGLSAGYQLTPDMRLNALAGFPVDIDNKTSINNNKTFYGFIFETGTFLEHWDMNLFYFDQEVDGLKDRTSAGADVRYRDNKLSLFGMIDYDLFYKEVNILQLYTNILFDHGRTAYMNAFMHKAPILSTSNALIGRTERTIEELKKVLNIEQIYQLAEDNTANSQTITIGGSQPLNKKFQLTADVTFSRVDDTVATPGTGTEYFLSTQLVGSNLLMKSDTGILGLRYYDLENSNTISLIANTRFPITRNWRINPRLQYDIRKFTDGSSQKKLRALLKTDYRYLNKVRFDFEVGYDATTTNKDQSLGNNNLFFMLGYRWDF